MFSLKLPHVLLNKECDEVEVLKITSFIKASIK